MSEILESHYHWTKLFFVLVVRISTTSGILFDGKFGCSVPEACDLVKTAKGLDLNIAGVSFHVGASCKAEAYQAAIRDAAEVFHYAESLGYQPDILDIGGGFPGTPDQFHTFREVSISINKILEQYFGTYSNLCIIAEPGRYFASTPYALTTTVIGKKYSENSGLLSFSYYLSDKCVGQIFYLIRKEFGDAISLAAPVVLSQHKDNVGECKVHPTTFWGPLCAPIDRLYDGPIDFQELKVGDWLYIPNVGGYVNMFFAEFCGFKKPVALYYIEETKRARLDNLMCAYDFVHCH